jgi:thiol-disulfide isomerase/thioredoxin
MEYIPLFSLSDLEDAVTLNAAVLVYFSSPSCSVCKVLKPKLAEMCRKEFPELKLFYVDTEKSPLIAGQFRVFSIPTLLVFFNEKEFLRISRTIGLESLKTALSRPYQMLFAT